MFTIPAFPSGSNFAEGLVIISILRIILAGICSSASAALKGVGLPSIRTVKLELPRNDTFPSMSTVTEGLLARTSMAVPLAEVGKNAGSSTFLSIS